jgi:hypothetical protein
MDRPSFLDDSDRATTANRATATAYGLEAQARAQWDLNGPDQMRRIFRRSSQFLAHAQIPAHEASGIYILFSNNWFSIIIC